MHEQQLPTARLCTAIPPRPLLLSGRRSHSARRRSCARTHPALESRRLLRSTRPVGTSIDGQAQATAYLLLCVAEGRIGCATIARHSSVPRPARSGANDNCQQHAELEAGVTA